MKRTIDLEKRRRAVIVGVGAVSAHGVGANTLWDSSVAGVVSIRPVEHLDMNGYRTTFAGEVPVAARQELKANLGSYEVKDAALRFAVNAAAEAMSGVGDGLAVDPEMWGLVLGTCNGGLLSSQRWYSDRQTEGNTTDPMDLVLSTPQGMAEAIASLYSIRGPVHSLNTACAAGANVIGYGAWLIQSGQSDAVLVAAADALSSIVISGFNSLESLSPAPATPYDRDRQGLSLGEGAGVLVLVEEGVANQAGIRPLAEVLGMGLSSDGHDPTAPHPEGAGAGRAMQSALRSAGLASEEIAYVNSHGTGTPLNDSAETNAVKIGLGDAAYQIPMSSTKSMIGHLLGAAGALEAIVTVNSIDHQEIPPTAGLVNPGPECDLDYVPMKSRSADIDFAMCNNFAFGGANASLVLARPASGRSLPPWNLDKVQVSGAEVLMGGVSNVDELWSAFERGAEYDDSDGPARVEVDENEYLTPRQRRRMDRLSVLSVIAAKRALQHANIAEGQVAPERLGIVFGTAIGPMESMERFAAPVLKDGPSAASPAVFPNTVYNAAAGQVSIALNAVGPTTTVTDGHAAGAAAMSYAADLLATDQADAIVVIGADTPTPLVADAYRDIGAGRRGFKQSEAVSAIVLERAASLEMRGGRPIMNLLAHSAANDAIGPGRWRRNGEALERAMNQALEQSKFEPNDVSSVWTDIGGYKLVDAAEESAIRRVFPGRDKIIRSPKRTLGDPGAAGPLVSLALLAEAWNRGADIGVGMIVASTYGGGYVAHVVAPPNPPTKHDDGVSNE